MAKVSAAPKTRARQPRPGKAAAVVPAGAEAVPFTPSLPFPVVAVGASAGGLAAFTELLSALSPKAGLGIVLIQHLQPTHESALATLLSRATTMPVVEVTDGLAVEPNHVYVIPPNKQMTIRDGALRLAPRAIRGALHYPIDEFMTALAAEQGSAAIGVVLSGTGSDGTLGLRAIRAAGGLAFTQDPKTAEWPAMPLNAGASVDYVLSPKRIAAELGHLAEHHGIMAPAQKGTEGTDLHKICLILGTATGIEFPLYKQATIRRRVGRRMALLKVTSLAQYAKLLRQNPEEVTALAEDIFIHVTSFFRDPDCFLALRKKVMAKWRVRRAPATVRIWVAGCSTGEEVYTLAILLLDELREQAASTKIQIFGTDIQQASVDKARAGIYSAAAVAPVSAARLKRYFVKTEHGYQIQKFVRELCVFARHDLAKDAPFSKLDLITCRNVLIYMGPELQARALSAFQYALNPGGCLFLGNTESISELSPHFSPEDEPHHIFCRKASISAPRSFPVYGDQAHVPDAVAIKTLTANAAIYYRAGAEACLLEHYMPAAMVVGPDLQIVHFQGNTSPYLAPATGQPSFHLLKIVRPEFVVVLRDAIAQVVKRGLPVRLEDLEFDDSGKPAAVNLEIRPLRQRPGRKFDLLVVFQKALEPQAHPASASLSGATARRLTAKAARVERELVSAREQLRAFVAEHEAAREEMRAANEEVLSGNEELQSTNEELETAKEELQSSNEELITLNEELQQRNTELSVLTQDLGNLLVGVDMAILVLDADLRVRRFTPVAAALFNLIPGDVGRPFTQLASNLEVSDWDDVVATVKQAGQPFEREVKDRSGKWFSLHIRPYKIREKELAGVLVVLSDVNSLKLATEEAQASRETALVAELRSQSILNSMRSQIALLNANGDIQFTNEAWRSFGSVNGIFDLPFGGGGTNYLEVCARAAEQGAPEAQAALEGIRSVMAGSCKTFSLEYPCHMPTAKQWFVMTVNHLLGGGGGVVVSHFDISQRKQLQAEAEKHTAILHGLLEASPQGVLACDLHGVITFVNQRVETLFGYSAAELLGQPMDMLVPESSRPTHVERHGAYFRDIQTRPMGQGLTLTGCRKDGTTFPLEVSLSGTEIDGEQHGVAFITDITVRKDAELALQRSEIQYRSLFDNMQEGVAYCRIVEEAGVGPDCLFLSVNKRFEELVGLQGIRGMTLTQGIPGVRESDPGLLAAFCRVASSGVPETLDYFLIYTQEWLALSLYCPEPSYLVIVFHKITERKNAEQAIHNSELQVRLALENTGMGTFDFDITTGKRNWSAIAKGLLGLPPEADVNEAEEDARIHPDDLANLRSIFSKDLRSDGSGNFAFDFRTTEVAGPSLRWISAWGKVLRDANGNREHAIGVMLDITESKQLALAVEESHQAIRALASRLLTAQEDERRRVARDLHDDICQQLAALAMDITAMRAKPGPGSGMTKWLSALQLHIARVAEETRKIAYQMHPSMLDDLGLVPSLRDLCHDYSSRYRETSFIFTNALQGATIPSHLKTCIYRTAQQGLQNVVEHARAKHVTVTLGAEAGVARLSVVDDGVGYTPPVPNGRHLGLISLQERANLVGGTVTVTVNPDGGTCLCLEVPLVPAPPERAVLPEAAA